jgi:processive 1,2-diacylglycerol beta-glucosyltransferase
MKVLILSISESSGHRLVADALESELLSREPAIEVKSLNFFHYLPYWFVTYVDQTYYSILKKKPRLWHKLRDSKCLAFFLKPFQFLFYLLSGINLYQRVIYDFKPDIVLCAQAYPCRVMGIIKFFSPKKFRLGAVITDYNMNAYWKTSAVDDYFVASKDMAQELCSEGISSNKVKALGIPIRSEFAVVKDRKEICFQNTWNPFVFTVLLMGGSLGMGGMIETLESLVSMPDVQVIVVTGSNEALRDQLQIQYHNHNCIHVYGFFEEISDAMDVAHMLVSKPGGVTMAEALAKGVPVISMNPLAGQEVLNEEYLCSQGHILKADAWEEMVDLITNHRKEWQTMFRESSVQGYPHATRDIVDSLH